MPTVEPNPMPSWSGRAKSAVVEPRGARYVPPEHWNEVSTRGLGFENEMFLKVPTLFLAGDAALLELPCVAIVGSRKVSPSGARRAFELAKALARVGIVTMSGLAEGVDEAAHRGALEGGGKTVAVIGTPLDKVYPAKHSALQQKIYEEHLLVSQFPIGTRTFPSHFPDRNRVMARLSRATVIIEAGDTSGSLHQAVECERSGRRLFIAREVLQDPLVKWPARFTRAIPLDTAEDVIAEVCS